MRPLQDRRPRIADRGSPIADPARGHSRRGELEAAARSRVQRSKPEGPGRATAKNGGDRRSAIGDRHAGRRPLLRRLGAGAALLAVLATAGCTEIENAMASVPFLAFMHESPAFDPYEAPRPAPPNAVPFQTPVGPYLPALEPSEAALTAFGDTATNPLPATEDVLEVGREAYDIYCTVCHGAEGQGNGPVVGPGKFPFAPDLRLPITQNRTDGYLYGIIRAGRGLMPAYARIPHAERWAIVHYVRQLQGQAGGQGQAQAAEEAAQ